jgi:hypothetical protein
MTSRNRIDWARLLQHKIDGILCELRRASGEIRLPIDLDRLQASFRIMAVEERPMIPEAATEPVPGGFRIFLQSNFSEKAWKSSRRRFTLAHEFCHTFFYDMSAGIPKRLEGAPKGDVVEKLCHNGAANLLVPTVLLRSEVQSLERPITAQDVRDLARTFGVSVEVIVRRLQEAMDSPIDRAIVLVGSTMEGCRKQILAAYWGPWILSHFESPEYGLDLDRWLNGVSDSNEIARNSGFERQVGEGILTASALTLPSQSKFLLETSFRVAERD